MINFKTEGNMISFMQEKINFEPEVQIICSSSYIDKVISEIESDCKIVEKMIDSDEYMYLISKTVDYEFGDIYLDIFPIVFSNTGEMLTEIYSEVVILQEGLLDDDDIEEIACEEFTIVDYSDDSYSDNEVCNCPKCDCGRELTPLSEKEGIELHNAIFNKIGTSNEIVVQALKSIDLRINDKIAEEKLGDLLEGLEGRETITEETCNCSECCGCCDCNENEEVIENNLIESEDVITAKLELIENELEDFGSIDIIVGYETAKAIVEEYSIQNYEDDFSIQIHSDVENYIISIEEDSIFICEPLEREGEYFHILSDCLYIDSEVEKYLDEDFYEFVTSDEVRVFELKEYISEKECNCEDCCETNKLSEVQADKLNDITQDVCKTTRESGMAIGEALQKPFKEMVERMMEDKLEEFEDMISEKMSDEEDFCIRCETKKLLVDTYMEAHYSGYKSGEENMREELENLLNK